MCNHTDVSYIGVQKSGGLFKELFLYNCKECYSTISLEKKRPKARVKRTTIKKKKVTA